MARTGRPPTDDPKNIRKELRFDKETFNKMNYLAGKMTSPVSASEVIRIAVNYLFEIYESDIKPLDDELNELNELRKNLESKYTSVAQSRHSVISERIKIKRKKGEK